MEFIFFIVIYFLGKFILRVIKSESEIKCPYCLASYDIGEGIWDCSNCNKTFRKIKDTVHKIEEVTYPLIDDIGILLSQVAKADGAISKEEKDYITSILVHNFDLNNKQKGWILNICNKARYENYSISTINSIKRESKSLKNPRGIYLDILYICMVIIHIDNAPSEKQNEIIKDIIDKFEISLSEYEEIKSDILGNSREIDRDHNQIEECFKILELPIGSSKDEIRKAYRKLVKVYHPDKYTSSELHENIKDDIQKKMIAINNAYEFLMNQNETV